MASARRRRTDDGTAGTPIGRAVAAGDEGLRGVGLTLRLGDGGLKDCFVRTDVDDAGAGADIRVAWLVELAGPSPRC